MVLFWTTNFSMSSRKNGGFKNLKEFLLGWEVERSYWDWVDGPNDGRTLMIFGELVLHPPADNGASAQKDGHKLLSQKSINSSSAEAFEALFSLRSPVFTLFFLCSPFMFITSPTPIFRRFQPPHCSIEIINDQIGDAEVPHTILTKIFHLSGPIHRRNKDRPIHCR